MPALLVGYPSVTAHSSAQRAGFNAAPLVRKRTAVTRLKRAKSAISIGDLKYKRCLVLAI